MSRVAILKREYPKGCLPPSGYVDWHEWAEAQIAHGLTQTQCEKCGLWLFPQDVEMHVHAKIPVRR